MTATRLGRWLLWLTVFAILIPLVPLQHASADTDLDVGGVAVIADANGDSVRLRTGPGSDYNIINRFPEGSQVEVIDGPVEADDGSLWYEVEVGGDQGFMISDYLSSSGGGNSGGGDISTNDSVYLRSGPGTNYSVIRLLPAGTDLQSNGSAQGGFFPVVHNGTSGWVYGNYLDGVDNGPIGDPSATGAANTNDSVNLRTGPSTSNSVITLIPAGASLSLLGRTSNGFLWVEYRGNQGWAYADYIGGSSAEEETDAWTTDSVNFRTSASTSSGVIRVLSPDTAVIVTGSKNAGFYPVRHGGQSGWLYADYVSFDEPSDDDGGSGEETDAWTTDSVNFRTSASTSSRVIRVLSSDTAVVVTGSKNAGFYPVRHSGQSGWLYGDYVTFDEPSDDDDDDGEDRDAWTTAGVNFRPSPSTSSTAIRVLPFGTAVVVTGNENAGFYPATWNGQSGWIWSEYITFDGQPSDDDDDDGGGGGGSSIAWPVSGSTWEITQGYNGSSHYNGSSTWQYYYSFDIARTDRNTAGQAVYSPVSGTVRWTDVDSGGMSIDLGNGYAVAFFHVTMDRSWQAGDRIGQGDYVGFVSGAGGEGYRQFPHVHLSVWATSDGGNWSRRAIPFTGQFAIAGVEYPDKGGTSQWAGTRFSP